MIDVKPLASSQAILEPLEERHRSRLAVAGADPEIWRLQPFNIAEGFDRYFDWMMAEKAAGRWIPFAVLDPAGTVVGQTCYLDLRPLDRGLEIGGTWYAGPARGTRVNPATKLLLLDHAFASGIVRVQFKTDAINARSRAAIEKLGATFEGTFRKHKRRPDGTWRDTVYYAIVDDDWPALRPGLERRLA